MPVADASVRRSANGKTITRCDSTRPVKVPPRPIWVKKRRKAMPSTTCGIISGERNSAASASRPRKRWRAMASAAGTAKSSASAEDSAPSQMLVQKAPTNSG